MTSPIAVIGLTYDGYDLQRADLDIFFQITEGLDDLPETRGSDDLIPFRVGRLPVPRIADRRPVVAMGWVTRSSTSTEAAYRAYIDDIKERLDPTGPPRTLIVTLEDGSQRWIHAVPRNLLPGDALGSDFRAFSIEWEALDPYWYGSWGDLTLDAGYLLDDGWFLDSSSEVIVAAGVGYVTINTLSTAPIAKVRVRFSGPSVGDVGIETVGSEPVGFRLAGALTSVDTLEVDNDARTVLLINTALVELDIPDIENVRNLLTLNPANQHGEYLRLPSGSVTLQILGSPAETRILFSPTYQ
jgi:hypothetical protein